MVGEGVWGKCEKDSAAYTGNRGVGEGEEGRNKEIDGNWKNTALSTTSIFNPLV